MESRYIVDQTKNHITEYHEGDISIIDVIELLKAKYTDNNIRPGIRATVDVRKANILFKPNQINTIVNLFKQKFEKVDQGKWAIIANTPNQVAPSTFLENLSYKLPFDIKVFTTVPAAKAWLNNE